MYAHIGKTLLLWQITDIRAIFGAVDTATGSRQYRRAYCEKPKKNGKTFVVGGCPIYHLVAEEQIERPEAYGAAATKQQAGLVFKAATELIESNPDLRDTLRVYPSSKKIVRRDGRGFYEVVSSDGKGTDGVEPSLVLIDEVHRWTTPKAQVLWDVLWKGQISRPDPLGIMTTTSGAEDESLIWNQERDFAEGVISGEIEAPTYYASLSQADERRAKEDPSYWISREARVTANPSHEDNGGFLKDAAIVLELETARKNGIHGETSFKRYHLGLRVASNVEAVIDMTKWEATNEESGIDLRKVTEYEPYEVISRWNLAERPCVLGVDLSWSNDLTALAAVFPPAGMDPWRIMLWFFMPDGKIRELEQKGQVPYSQWVRKGFIDACPGNANDYRRIVDRIRWCREMFEVREVAYDPYNARPKMMELADEGFVTTEISQWFSNLSAPTKEFLVAIESLRMWHGNNPVMNFCARSLALEYDNKDNVMPAKPKRMKDKKRIDGVSATVTAMARAMVMVENGCDLDSFLSSPIRA